ncbi:MAG TPA: DUF1294 domain-containing protein [Erysipelotrichaceae bacterium]|nr:DUF1294 domain-containing protein [Erysipelotrichaceae bacterium]HAO62258.1 DUF1294 domain-containing protein [Erysipelotrichaceae bacterium]
MIETVLSVYLLLSIIGFILVYVDKRKAIRHDWRIPEKTFFLLGLIGGATGIWAGMFRFHHKTRKTKFVAILLADLIFNILFLYLL